MQHSKPFFQSPFAELDLHRIPTNNGQANSLRAWDAADELMLNQLAQQQLPKAASKLLIVNDNFGALSCSLSDYSPTNWNDSLISHLACQDNLNAINELLRFIFCKALLHPLVYMILC